jgi:alpha-glucuronidase
VGERRSARGLDSPYYHRADKDGIGFDRSASGSNAVGQYFPEVAAEYGRLDTVPEHYLLWFHHVPWDHRMRSGRTLWEELLVRYQAGVDAVRAMQATWAGLASHVDPERYEQVRVFLGIQSRKRAGGGTPACCTSRPSRAGRSRRDTRSRPTTSSTTRA